VLGAGIFARNGAISALNAKGVFLIYITEYVIILISNHFDAALNQFTTKPQPVVAPSGRTCTHSFRLNSPPPSNKSPPSKHSDSAACNPLALLQVRLDTRLASFL
jgi:hypothetical protein